ncbi:MAG: hypothetical protein P8J86_03350 [Phycisphaerales bacterium]|nr:hypothetical protein [Phycisphaerales bacterium]
MFHPNLLASVTLLITLFSVAAVAIRAEDQTPEPGGVYGGTYVPWGLPPFVEREKPPKPGGAFEGKPMAKCELKEKMA